MFQCALRPWYQPFDDSTSALCQIYHVDMSTFSARLVLAIRSKKTPAIVGLDPRWESLPEAIRSSAPDDSRSARAEGFLQFCREIIDVVAPLVPAVKPQ